MIISNENCGKKHQEQNMKVVINDAVKYIRQTKSDWVEFLKYLRNSNGYHKYVRAPFWFIFDFKCQIYDTKICLFTLPLYNKFVKNGEIVIKILWHWV